MRSRKMKTALLVAAVVALAGCGSQEQRPLTSISGGKSDFGGFDIHFPTIGKGKSFEWKFEANGAFKVELTQPDVASSKQALVRLRLDDGTHSEQNTQSSKTPSLEWTTASSGMTLYTLTITNRSSTKELNARVVGTAFEGFAPPAKRRTFCKAFAFDGPKVTVAFFDADATLRVPIDDEGYTPDGPGDQVLIPGATKAVREANERGELVAIVSNQGGVHYGSISFENAEAALVETASLLAAAGSRVHYLDFAETYDNNRKPDTGMADRLAQKLDVLGLEIDWDTSYMVGDAGWKSSDREPEEVCGVEGGIDGTDFSHSDREFAENLSIPYNHPRYYYGWNKAPYNVNRFESDEQVAQFYAEFPDFDD